MEGLLEWWVCAVASNLEPPKVDPESTIIMIRWTLGLSTMGRDHGMLKGLLDKMTIKYHLFVTDDFEAYHRSISKNQHVTDKDLT